MLILQERRKLEYPEKNLLVQSREPTKYPRMTPSLVIEPGPLWCKSIAALAFYGLQPYFDIENCLVSENSRLPCSMFSFTVK